MKHVEIGVGGSVKGALAEFASAWKRAARGGRLRTTMRRRLIVASVALPALACIGLAHGQTKPLSKSARIGVLIGVAEDADGKARVSAFRQGLEKLGWMEGRNLQVEYRWAAGDAARAQTYARELISSSPDALLAGGITAAVALARQTKTIPIVFAHASDPVGSGIVASLARPGGNVTGFTGPELTVPGKYLEFLKEIAPGATKVIITYGGKTVPGGRTRFLKLLESDAASLRLQASALPLDDATAIDGAIAAFARAGGGGIVVLQDIFTTAHKTGLISAAARYRLPAVYSAPAFAGEGGLVAYGSSPLEAYQGAAGYVDRILRGENPANLPVQQPMRYELVVNMKTAKALGLTIPPTVMVRADRVIE